MGLGHISMLFVFFISASAVSDPDTRTWYVKVKDVVTNEVKTYENSATFSFAAGKHQCLLNVEQTTNLKNYTSWNADIYCDLGTHKIAVSNTCAISPLMNVSLCLPVGLTIIDASTSKKIGYLIQFSGEKF